MISPIRLRELAALCEAASGPDRELDDAITSALYDSNPERHCIKGLSDEAGGMWMFRYPNGSIGSSLRFSGSIDAALTLVPDGWTYVNIEICAKGLEGQHCRASVERLISDDDERAAGHGKTGPLALCAAALLALASQVTPEKPE